MNNYINHDVVSQKLISLDFSDFINVENRFTISDLFPKSQRCGLYCLHFKDGDYYIGRSVNVVRRFREHYKEKGNIKFISFKNVKENLLANYEVETIRELEKTNVKLRNIVDMSVIIGETDLDYLISPEQQTEWLADDSFCSQKKESPEDFDLRRRLQERWDKLSKIRDIECYLFILRLYVTKCIIEPCATELSLWSISCLPYHGGVLYRINISRQEVFYMMEAEGDLAPYCCFYVKRSIFTDGLRDARLLPPSFQVINRWYNSGGIDQICICATRFEDMVALLELPWFRRAAKHMNLNLMRKGSNFYATNHCFALADQIWGEKNIQQINHSLTENIYEG